VLPNDTVLLSDATEVNHSGGFVKGWVGGACEEEEDEEDDEEEEKENEEAGGTGVLTLAFPVSGKGEESVLLPRHSGGLSATGSGEGRGGLPKTPGGETHIT